MTPATNDEADKGTAMLPDEDLHELLRHELKGPLTTIQGHAQLLQRRLARMEGVDEEDRSWLRERGALIDAAVAVLVARIDRIGRPESSGDGRADP